MNEKTLRLLEFDRIRIRVAECALSEESARQIQTSDPETDSAKITELRELVQALFNRIRSGDVEKRDSIPDIAELLPVLAVEGSVLTLDEAYALGIFVNRASDLLKWLEKDSAPVLKTVCASIPDCSAVPAAVFKILDKEGKLRDLPEFRDIQRRILSLNRELESALGSYMQTEESRRMLQSTIPSQRDGRLVLALKANFRGRIPGIIHEVSSTGQTIFVEPAEIVEKNNAITLEQGRLNAEIQKVLRNMTARIAESGPALHELHEKIVFLETIRARARYSYETKGIFVPESPALTLKRARHPLLLQPVPIDFSLDPETTAAIITGPNTGGKTVALKTVGLFALMNQFGLALPSDDGTCLPFFDGIYADIGDEQSLSQSLSTFSAHITNIASLIALVTKRSLVLIDELGSGTDPAEGSALAMAILDHLIKIRSRLIVTTHHGVLKNYGYTHTGVENASVEFDSHTLSPTYRIIMGIPGESRAVDIAARNGLQPDIVAQARSYLEDGRSDVSTLIAGLKEKHQSLDSAADAIRKQESRLREEKRKADLRELRLRQKEGELKAEGVGRLHTLLQESRKTLENLVKELKEGELSREKTLKVKEFLHDLEQLSSAEESRQEHETQAFLEEQRRVIDPEPGVPDAIRPGITVRAGTSKNRGTVLRRDKKGLWVVEIGSLKMSFADSELVPVAGEKPVAVSISTDISAGEPVVLELKLLGMHLEEALERLQRQLDAAVLAGIHEFAVIHGTGEGVLQRGVQDFLRNQPVVADFHFSRPEIGGFGRTEVILR